MLLIKTQNGAIINATDFKTISTTRNTKDANLYDIVLDQHIVLGTYTERQAEIALNNLIKSLGNIIEVTDEEND